MVAMSDGVLPRRGGARVLDDVELVPGDWEPVLDYGTWTQVRAVLDDPRRGAALRGNTLKYALGPIARCWCGSKMHVHIDRWTTNTGTSEMTRLMCDDTKCATGIGYAAVEEAVTAAVLDLLDQETWNRIRTTPPSEPTDSAAVEEKLARMWAMVLDGAIEPEEYAEAKARWAGAQVATTTAPADLPDVDDVRAAWPDLGPQERLLIFRAAIEHLVIRAATRRGGRGVDLGRIDLETV
jgi:hypothetical protein